MKKAAFNSAAKDGKLWLANFPSPVCMRPAVWRQLDDV